MISQQEKDRVEQPQPTPNVVTIAVMLMAVLVAGSLFVALLNYSTVNAATSLLAGTTTATPAAASKTPKPRMTPTQALPPTAFYVSNDATSLCVGVEDPAPIVPSTTQFWGKPDQVIDPTHTYCAIIKTDKGRMVAELYAKEAPKNVNAFVFLAQQGFYDNLTWHRVIQDFVAQTGDPTGNGAGGPGFSTPLEVVSSLKYDKPGVIGMARSQHPDSAGSQFFITFAALPNLDPSSQSQGYTIIGQVVEGLDVLNKIKFRDPSTDAGSKGDPLVSIRIVDVIVRQ